MDLGLDNQFVSRAGLLPAVHDALLEFVESLVDERLGLEVGDIGKPQDRGRLFQLIQQQVEPRYPLLAHDRRIRLEHGIGNIETDDAMDRRAKVYLEALAARRPLYLDGPGRGTEAAWQCPVVELQHEIRSTALIRHDGARDVVATVGIGRRCESSCRHDADTRQAAFVAVLVAIAVAVVVNLAGDVRAVESRVRNDPDFRRRLGRHDGAGQPVHRERAVDEFALGHTGADSQQEFDLVTAVGLQQQIRPGELTTGYRRFGRRVIEARRSFDIFKAGRELVDDIHVAQIGTEGVAHGDDVRHQLATGHVQHRRRLGHGNGTVEARIERYVVIEQLARSRDRRVIECQEQMVVRLGAAGRHSYGRRELGDLRLTVLCRCDHGVIHTTGAGRHGKGQRRKI